MQDFKTEFSKHETIFIYGSPEAQRFTEYENMGISSDDMMLTVKLMNKYNIPFTFEKNDYVYDGNVLSLGNLDSFHAVCHEIGHFLVAPEKYKKCVNYGLGAALQDILHDSPETRGIIESHYEDFLAGIFGIYLEYSHGKDISITIGNIGNDEKIPAHELDEVMQYFMDRGMLF